MDHGNIATPAGFGVSLRFREVYLEAFFEVVRFCDRVGTAFDCRMYFGIERYLLHRLYLVRFL